MPATPDNRIDGLTTSVAVKAPCVAATTVPITLSGEQTINSVACVEGNRVLVKDQVDTTTNGIYVVSTGTWTRALDFDGNRDAVNGTLVVVVNAAGTGILYRVVCTTSPVVFGTTAMTFQDALLAPSVSDLLNITANTTGTFTAPNFTTNGQIQMNGFVWNTEYTTASANDVYGMDTYIIRTAGAGLTVGDFITAQANSGVTSETWAMVTQAWAKPGASPILICCEHGLINETNSNASVKYGTDIVFKDRPDGQAGTTQALGVNKFNMGSVAIHIDSQARSTTGEKCGWRRGIKFELDALDADFNGTAIGIDFAYVHNYGGSNPLTTYRMTAAIRLRSPQSILWNGLASETTDPANPIRTYTDEAATPSTRFILSNTAIEEFGVDVTNGGFYRGVAAGTSYASAGAFMVTKSVDQTINDAVYTKVNFNTELFDDNNEFDSATNFRFTPKLPGKFQLQATALFSIGVDAKYCTVAIYKNGAIYKEAANQTSGAADGTGCTVSCVATANGTTDYFEVFCYQNGGAGKTISVGGSGQSTFFSGFRIPGSI